MPDESDGIEALDWCEAIRRRPAMYIGDTGPLGLRWLVRALLECPKGPRGVVLTLRETELAIETASIPLSTRPREDGLPPYMIEICTRLTIGLDEPSTISGVEVLDTDTQPAVFRRVNQAPPALAIANALSSALTLESRQQGSATSARFSRGRLVRGPDVAATPHEDGVLVVFRPDEQIFGSAGLRFDSLAEIVRDFSAVRRVRVDVVDEASGLRFTAVP